MKLSSFDIIVGNTIVSGISRSIFSEINGVDPKITDRYNDLLESIKSWDHNDPNTIHILDINKKINDFETLLKLKIHVGIDIIRYAINTLLEDEFKRRIVKTDADAFSVFLKCGSVPNLIKHYRRKK